MNQPWWKFWHPGAGFVGGLLSGAVFYLLFKIHLILAALYVVGLVFYWIRVL